jgi:hypothetical protein
MDDLDISWKRVWLFKHESVAEVVHAVTADNASRSAKHVGHTIEAVGSLLPQLQRHKLAAWTSNGQRHGLRPQAWRHSGATKGRMGRTPITR